MILIIDFGSQFTQLVARRIRELQVYSEIVPYSRATEKINDLKEKNELVGIIFSGGPHSVYDPSAPSLPEIDLTTLGVPVLGICYGLQLMNVMLGGQVEPSQNREYGFETISIPPGSLAPHNPLYPVEGLPQTVVWMSHGDEISQLAPCLDISAQTRQGTIAAFHHRQLPLFGVQFHPEVEHSTCGRDILQQFVRVTCQAPARWDTGSQIETSLAAIRALEALGQENAPLAICALSGGVDSCVAAVLASKVFGDRLHCLFINNGLLRKNEYENVLQQFKHNLNLNVRGIDASDLFLNRLAGVTDPETKRKIIGKTFIDVFEDEAKKLGRVQFLVQGTLYPDVIESVSVYGSSVTIKSHHNVGGLPKEMSFSLIEPLRELFKDEVRILGRALDIPESILERHPFPGPGLGIRVLGEVTRERLNVLREADAILVEELHLQSLYRSSWQAFVVLLPVQSVGVMGDQRTYENVAAIRCVTAIDGMTADWSRLPHEFLAHVSSRIINEVRGINRVVYDISSKPPATIEWE